MCVARECHCGIVRLDVQMTVGGRLVPGLPGWSKTMKPENRKLSRRAFGRLVAASSLAARASGGPPQAAPAEDELRAANERRLATAQALAKFELPMTTEPSFVFKP